MEQIFQDDKGWWQIKGYLEYLGEIQQLLPRQAREFALMPWHYDFYDHKCPHDSRVESVVMTEGLHNGQRVLDIRAKFLGAFGDVRFDVVYQNVQAYDLSLSTTRHRDTPVGHGQWIIDEVLVDSEGRVTHEIEFSDSGNWFICCEDIVYSWRDAAEGELAYSGV